MCLSKTDESASQAPRTMQSRLTRPRILDVRIVASAKNRSAAGTNLARDPPAIERDPWRAVSPAEFAWNGLSSLVIIPGCLEGARR